MKQVNQFNFLRWHTSEVFIPTNYDPAQGYMRDGKRCDYMPLLINGEPLNFYINTTDGLNAIIPGLSNLAVSSQANITAAEWAFTLSGVPNAGDIVTVDFTVDTVHYNINSTVIAGWDLTDLINDLYAKILALNPAALPYVSGLNHGVLIQGTSTASGTATATKYDATANAKLKLVDAITGQVVNADIATLLQDSFVDADGNNVFTYYANVSPSLVAPAVYFFRIGDASNNFLESNLVFVPADANYSNYSCLCKFRSDRYYYGVNYQNLDDFYQQFRLHLNEIDEQYENDRDVYNEVSTGKQRVYNNYKKKLRTLETYYFDKSAHDAAEIMFDSEEIYINGRQYTPKATYKVSTNALSKLNKGSIDLYDYDFATANRCLTQIAAAPGCIGISLPEITLPDGTVGSPYNYSITLTGDQPFQLTNKIEPNGLHWGISGNILSLSGIPTTAGALVAAVTVSNCSDDASDNFSGTVTIAPIDEGVITVELSMFGNTLTACVSGGTPPYAVDFVTTASGSLCAFINITNPHQTVTDQDGCCSTTFSYGAFSGAHYTIKATVNADDAVSGTININPCLVPETLIKTQDGTEIMLKDVQVGQQLFDSRCLYKKEYVVNMLYVINNGLLRGSAQHVNILYNGNLVLNEHLKVGDFLIDENRNPIKVKSIDIQTGEFTVISIGTDTEDYIANGIRTHNKLAC